MKGARVLLEMLKRYDVKHIFGLPGETTIPLYVEWSKFPEIKHILTRDERNASFMADAYAKVSFKPGICESPSVGATHVIPGIAEAYKSSVPLIVFTTDVPLHLEKKNMLTGFEQTPLFSSITKESLTILKASEIPFILRRAFRMATTGKPGPVHIRVPQNILEEEVASIDLRAQKEFSRYPGHRQIADKREIKKAVELLLKSETPLIICGQGALYSQAWEEIKELAELLAIPVGTTISGKGSFPERHPLSIGVIGIRGGTIVSNKAVEEADLIFYIGCNTDYVTTDGWKLPSADSDKAIIHLDISEAEVSNNYITTSVLIGDAKATLKEMIKVIKDEISQQIDFLNSPRIKALNKSLNEYREALREGKNHSKMCPLEVIETLNELLSEREYILAIDPGISAIYTSAFFKADKPGRRFLFNFSLGALGYAIPASIGAHYANPEIPIVALTGDGSFGFTAGELETIARTEGNIKIILFNNDSFGWIRATIRLLQNASPFATDFKKVDHVKVAEGFGLRSYKIEKINDLKTLLKEELTRNSPSFIELNVDPEDELIPPVPSWLKIAKEKKLAHIG